MSTGVTIEKFEPEPLLGKQKLSLQVVETSKVFGQVLFPANQSEELLLP